MSYSGWEYRLVKSSKQSVSSLGSEAVMSRVMVGKRKYEYNYVMCKK